MNNGKKMEKITHEIIRFFHPFFTVLLSAVIN